MSLYTPRKTTSNKVRIVFERETLEDDWEVDEIQGADEIEPPTGRSEHDWVWDFATTTVNEDHFFDPAEVDGVLRVAVTGVLEGWWSSTTDGEDYDEDFELEKLEVLPKEEEELEREEQHLDSIAYANTALTRQREEP
jgi:hypothetical protein